MKTRHLFALILAGTCLAPTVAATQERSVRVRYDAYYLGLPIGKAEFDTRLNKAGYAISGSFASAGLVRIFDQTNGRISINGRFAGSEIRPNSYDLKYSSGKKQKRTTIAFDGSKVSKTTNVPELKKRKDKVPLKQDHLTGVADPISASLINTDDAASVCRQTLKVYDGEMRVDLKLSPAPRSESFKQSAVTCRGRFVPLSGHRPNHSSIKFLRDKAVIRIGFNPVEGTSLYSPSEAIVGTKIGNVHVKARRIQ
ncbi:DUF3108 domain-containing protein [Nitratireductor basaltis]|uniref:DUF3108 domain-containing protein n=1 Tax=Nitratireductor basaltis TaxID=472175 RepID=A0A084U7I1_9HYPH|nr:DUF3108 domain-containing protein [Nitratireductor basaltis]KFB08917.1 hypothetical protein EL18_03172 [Nitratireductor basaltis]